MRECEMAVCEMAVCEMAVCELQLRSPWEYVRFADDVSRHTSTPKRCKAWQSAERHHDGFLTVKG